ncbi:S41 family peptidase [Aliifodinibius sp. S!AR15-10]|uniref:S41 family peptidase n=1 Tax=Aliifodinibius sp. S!AR15-10 TaxID=2950437 RepID=UPI002857F0D6|nr:S41 family peptidase [Aliifodinibius sp. S!AR15-10]MDR8389793.1 S41 family peptidase [Aliifodinibius sp. S!AR15-10]
MNKKLKITAITGSLVLFMMIAGAARLPDLYFQIKKNFTIFSEVFREVSLNYVDEVDPEKLMRKGISSMLETLDPYTVFIDEAQNQELDIITRGNYGGVGLEVGFRGDRIVVIAPMEGYPAHQKGIRTGDVIVAVNGVSVENLSAEEVQNMTLGEPSSSVSLTIERYGNDQQLEFELTRQRIDVKNVAYRGLVGSENDIGYILLSRFSQNTAEEVRNAISQLQSKNQLKGLILDLRNNPGGLLNEAVSTVDKFVEPGVKVVETRGRLSEHNSVYRTEEPAMLDKMPLVVLQNGGSASASEIVAGALQDLDRAVIIGEQSFGKGLVQVVRPLSYNTALKITTAKYYIPSGRSIQSITYTHDENNSQINKPDSARKAFQTRNGRTVYDGQGIAPDIQVAEPAPSLLETALFQNSHFFFFANQYVANHDTFQAEGVTDEMFTDFQEYLGKKNFSYETQTEQHLDEIEEHFASIDTDNGVSQGLAQIEQALEKEKQKNMQEQKDELKEILYLELVSRYRGQTGKHEASVLVDPFVKKGIEVIKNANRYRQILAINQ